jgi:hypothetical protein
MKTFAVLGATALIASSASAQNPPVNDPTWRNYSVTRTITAAGNTQYRVYANYSASNITYLNAFDFRKVHTNGPGSLLPTQVGENLNAYHSGLGESTWIPFGLATASHVPDDSWVTSTGTHVGSQTALDPSFVETDVDGNPIPAALATPPLFAGWYDATPASANAVGAGSLGGWDGQVAAGGWQILLMQIVRQGDDSTNGMEKFTFNLTSGFKYAGTTQARFGFDQVSIGVPGPGALALLGLAGAFGRRRR